MLFQINYLTGPLSGTRLTSRAYIHYVATFIVGDRRSSSQIYSPSPTANPVTYDKYTAKKGRRLLAGPEQGLLSAGLEMHRGSDAHVGS